MNLESRRRFLGDILRLAPTYVLLQFLFARDLFADAERPAAHRWLLRIQEASDALRGGEMPAAQWQRELETLFGGVTLPELMSFIDFNRLARAIERPPDRAAAQRVDLPPVEGLPRPQDFATKVFALGPGVAIVPHGHRNMASMHLVLSGEVRLRHYERVRDEADHLIIRPSIDRKSGPGDCSSISSQKDNIHWFRNLGDAAFTLDFIVDNLDPGLGFPYRMDFVDAAGGDKLEGDLVRAPRISFERALALYGPSGTRI